jgi:hypothetical protein
MKNIMLWLIIVLIGLLFVGCSSNTSNSMGLSTSTSFTVKWDNINSRNVTAPPNVNSIIIRVYQDTNKINQVLSNRPESGNTTTLAFFGLPIASLRFTVSAYSGTNGTGVLLSSSEITFTPGMGTNQLTLNMHSVPESLSAFPSSLNFDINDSSSLVSITGYDSLNNIIIFNNGELDFSISNPSIATFVKVNAAQVRITPKTVGSTQLVVKSTAPGSTVTINVPISVTTMAISTNNVTPNIFTLSGGRATISATITGGTPIKVEAEISGGTFSVPEKVILLPVSGVYTGLWTAPSNASQTGNSVIYTVKIKATTLLNQIIESNAGTITVKAAELPPNPVY